MSTRQTLPGKRQHMPRQQPSRINAHASSADAKQKCVIYQQVRKPEAHPLNWHVIR